MGYQRYSVKEALNRFYRLWSGNEPPSDAPDTLDGVIFSEDEAWSNIAELMAGSLPGVTASVPSHVSITGTVGHVDEFGQVYLEGGDVPQCYPTGTWTVMPIFTTGSYSSALVDNDFANNRITLNSAGYYRIAYAVSANATQDVTYIIRAAVNGTIQSQTGAIFNPLTVVNTGTYDIPGDGIIYATAVPSQVDLRMLATATGTFNVSAASLCCWKMN